MKIKTTKYFCDICGKEINRENISFLQYFNISFWLQSKKIGCNHNIKIAQGKELCYICADKLLKLFSNCLDIAKNEYKNLKDKNKGKGGMLSMAVKEGGMLSKSGSRND